ncbi:pyridoxal 5'-phosphate synthase glutaminase subunit PdxT [Sulfurisphaera tokodaii]|uniref:Pyridoxal 5'-phosphate synthase subunit PdxT n=2 Tax=Sulfurisphaera tokodaii TaxID=111955 RepID=PDXT_SULTO|nr:pyridoxal 5'-phosphate synthase glutaminase subunit PdxT [Sulfurisphaera tokodaii]Q971B2.1 RecName: Full=Pyridoxal 5'-phosphate synthase subunit PdxT; AltName: Full=Pdx2; AltName: Full=Pyridoxal 5'-phosphate synthase glutaminase subunit [Sulfurisphaera tokodaii str. 7]BAB66511.1 pyridoxal 5'-phosphate biosynthesis protein PdxT [Sulfurisphaera tokodaii str. 7]HII73673.1 pyridoxal 5'-phosphate synthase glutaminase subunit PdxT [Sulfurisphaera tokodaii]
MKIGIVAYQGSFEEHALQTKRALDNLKIQGDIVAVKKPNDLKDVDAIIIPGGESTTIGVVAQKLGILDELKEKINSGIPTLGTCAGAIILAKDVTDAKVGKKSQPLIGSMDISVIRNYYGRQRESFEATVDLSEIGGGKTRVVFIRAPAIVKTWGDAKPLSKLNDVIIMAMERNMVATTFHPELSSTTVIHEFLIKMAKK